LLASAQIILFLDAKIFKETVFLEVNFFVKETEESFEMFFFKT